MKKRNEILLSIYAVLCLVEIPISIRWGGRTPAAYFDGILSALVAFGVPVLFAWGVSAIWAKRAKKPFLECFNSSLTVIIICCGISLGFIAFFMLTFKF